MKVRYLKLKNWLLVTVMGALGVSACHCQKEVTKEQQPAEKEVPPAAREREEIRLMYGVPTMNFMIRGQVKDSDGRPVKDIRLNMLERGMEVKDGQLQGDPNKVKEWLEYSSVSTDREGRFELKNRGIPQEQVRVLVRDVDGSKNGSFKDQLLEVPVRQGDVDREGAGGWNQGTFSKEVEINLENK